VRGDEGERGVPKVTISLSRDVFEALSRGGASPSEKVKEIVTLYAERTSKARERATAVVEVLREVQEHWSRIIASLKSRRLEDVDSEITSALRLSKVALALATSLPLTEGERLCVASLKKACELLEERKGSSTNLFAPSACALITLIMGFLPSLIMDVAVELKDLGDLKKHEEFVNSLQEILSAMSGARKPT
jgi:hypothetical protein